MSKATGEIVQIGERRHCNYSGHWKKHKSLINAWAEGAYIRNVTKRLTFFNSLPNWNDDDEFEIYTLKSDTEIEEAKIQELQDKKVDLLKEINDIDDIIRRRKKSFASLTGSRDE